jgi:polar amino acid transport system permease protein
MIGFVVSDFLDALTNQFLLVGVLVTAGLTVAGLAGGLILGLVLALLRASGNKAVGGVARGYIWFFRGTPLLIQMVMVYSGLPQVGIKFGVLVSVIVTLVLNEAAYMAEIIRGGFASVPKGQFEAAESLGMRGFTKLRRVIIPQTMPAIIPATGNQVIGMLKETSLVSVLGVADLLQSAQAIYARTYETIPLLIVASLWYLIMTLTLSVPQSMIERRFSRSSRPVVKVKESLL